MQEFIYYSASELDFPLNEQIFVTTNFEDTKNKNFLIYFASWVNLKIQKRVLIP